MTATLDAWTGQLVAPVSTVDVAALMATAAPPGVSSVSSLAGSSGQASRADHTHLSSVQRKKLTVGTNGLATWTFGTAFLATPVVASSAENSATTPVFTEIYSVSTTQVTFRCWSLSSMNITLAGLTAAATTGINLFGLTPSGVIIDAIAAPPTP